MRSETYILIALAIPVAIGGLIALAIRIRMRPAVLAVLGTALVLVVVAALIYAPLPTLTPSSPRFQQSAGQSVAGKSDTTTGKSEEERAQEIAHEAQPLNLSEEQRHRIRDALSNEKAIDSVDTSLSVGAAVPRQIQLRDLPTELADVLHGYNGDKYFLVGAQLVIVDNQARRIAAIIPGVKDVSQGER